MEPFTDPPPLDQLWKLQPSVHQELRTILESFDLTITTLLITKPINILMFSIFLIPAH